jgi:hypothetical protein
VISGSRYIPQFFLHFMIIDSDGDGDSVDPHNLESNNHADVEIISIPQPLSL